VNYYTLRVRFVFPIRNGKANNHWYKSVTVY
jgi:hypothetical protein